MQKGPCLNLNKAVKTCKHIAKDHENNNKFVHLRVSSSRVGVLFRFLYWCICNKCCSSQCKLYKLYLSCSVQEKSLLEVLLTGAITLPQVFYSCRKAKQNRKQNSFFFCTQFIEEEKLANLAIVVDVLLLDLLTNTVPLKWGKININNYCCHEKTLTSTNICILLTPLEPSFHSLILPPVFF